MMNGNEWVWANHPRPGRLAVSQDDETILRFTDTETRETLVVNLGEVPQGLTVDVYQGDSNKSWKPLAVGLDYKFNHRRRGYGITSRDVWQIVTKDHCQALRLGLTTHISYFSSTPHTFELVPEPGFEEVFYFMTEGKLLLEGAGLWSSGEPVDDAWPVIGGQFAQIPMGHHRVVALPDARGLAPAVSYIWCYLCTKEAWEK